MPYNFDFDLDDDNEVDSQVDDLPSEDDEMGMIEEAASAVKKLFDQGQTTDSEMPQVATPNPVNTIDISKIGKDDTKPDDPTYIKVLDLLDAPGNATRGAAAQGLNWASKNFGAGSVNIKPIDGRYGAESFRKGYGLDYLADQKRSFRDDINDLFSSKGDAVDQLGSLGKRLVDGSTDFAFENLSDPTTYLGVGLANRAAKGLKSLKVADKAADLGGRALVGAGYGVAGNLANDNKDLSPTELLKDAAFGAATFGAAKPIAEGFVGGLNAVGKTVLVKSLGEKTIEYAGKTLELAEAIKNPTIQKAAVNAQRRIGYIGHEIRQGRLKALENLSDEDAVLVNKAFKEAKNIENEIAHDTYANEARQIFGDEAMDAQLALSKKELESESAKKSAEYRKATGSSDYNIPTKEQMDDLDKIQTRDIDVGRHAADTLLEKYANPEVKNYLWNKARNTAKNQMSEGNAAHDAIFASLQKESATAAKQWADHNESIVAKYNSAKGLDEVFNPNIEFRLPGPRSSDFETITKFDGGNVRPVITKIEETTPGKKPQTTRGYNVADDNGQIVIAPMDRLIPGTPDTVSSRLDVGSDSIGPTFSSINVPRMDVLADFKPLENGKKVMIKGGDLESLKKSPMVGFKYHTEDVFDKESFELSKKMFSAKTGFTRGIKGGQGDAAEKMIAEGVPAREAYDKAYAAYSEEASGAFLDQAEKEAMALTGAAGRELGGGLVVGTADKITKLFKRNVLYASTSWFKQQFYDNAGKRFIEHGYTWDDGLAKGLTTDIDSVLKGKASHISSDQANEYIKHGVVDSDFVTDAMDMTDYEKRLRYSTLPKDKPDGLLDRAIKQQDEGYGIPLLKRWNQGTQDFGQYLEWNARAKTYERIKGKLIQEAKDTGKELSDDALNSIRDKAGQTTRDIFFDYRDVTAVEQQLIKRLIPFYTFTSKNLGYYADVLTEGSGRTARAMALEKIHSGAGRSAFQDEDAQKNLGDANNYARKGDPRVLKNDDSDFLAMLVNPKSAKMDALNMMAYPADLVKAYLSNDKSVIDALISQDNPLVKGAHPTPKAIAEMAAKRDMFSGQNLNPQESQKKVNWIGQRGYFGENLNALARLAGMDNWTGSRMQDLEAERPDNALHGLRRAVNDVLGVSGVRISEKTGNPETDSDSTMYANKVRDALPSVPIAGPLPLKAAATLYNVSNTPLFNTLNQLIYQATGESDKKKTVADTLIKLFTPLDVIRKEKK